MSAKLLIIGLDGASWRLTQTITAEGRMPTLSRMMAQGTAGPLYSTVPPISPTAWASFMTGKNPGKHGIFGFGMKVPNSYFIEPFSARGRVQAATLWGILSNRNRRVAVINVPMTFPPEPVNGLMISGFGTPDESGNRFVYPPEEMDELRAQLGPYILDLNWAEYESRGIPALLEDARTMTRRRADYALHILRREPWDLFTAVFVGTDRVQHCLWQYLEPRGPLTPEQQQIRAQVLDYYDFLDGILAELLDASPEGTTLVMSDHGFGPFRAYVQLNTWLAEEGFLTWQTKNKARMRWAVQLAKRLGLTRERFRQVARWLGLDEYKHLEKVSQRVNNIEWAKTRAFAYTPDGIFLNLKGRERQGTVEPGAEADRVLDEISQRLLNLRDPTTGKHIVQKVARPQEIYQGPKVELSPDLVITEYDASYLFNFNLYPTPQAFVPSSWRSGQHEPEGLLVAYGPQVAKGRRMERADLMDLCPTSLFLLREPVPNDMDGRVLTELLVDQQETTTTWDTCAPEQPAEGDMLTPEEKELVFQRLKGLGYFE